MKLATLTIWMSHDAKVFLLGVAFLPLFVVALTVYGILARAFRDTLKMLSLGLKPGYSRWRWPYLLLRGFMSNLRQQCWSYWHGVETTVDYE